MTSNLLRSGDAEDTRGGAERTRDGQTSAASRSFTSHTDVISSESANAEPSNTLNGGSKAREQSNMASAEPSRRFTGTHVALESKLLKRGRLRELPDRHTTNPPYTMPKRTKTGVGVQRRLGTRVTSRPDVYGFQQSPLQDPEPPIQATGHLTMPLSTRTRRGVGVSRAKHHEVEEPTFREAYDAEIRSSGEQLKKEAGDGNDAEAPRRSPRKPGRKSVGGLETSAPEAISARESGRIGREAEDAHDSSLLSTKTSSTSRKAVERGQLNYEPPSSRKQRPEVHHETKRRRGRPEQSTSVTRQSTKPATRVAKAAKQTNNLPQPNVVVDNTEINPVVIKPVTRSSPRDKQPASGKLQKVLKRVSSQALRQQARLPGASHDEALRIFDEDEIVEGGTEDNDEVPSNVEANDAGNSTNFSTSASAAHDSRQPQTSTVLKKRKAQALNPQANTGAKRVRTDAQDAENSLLLGSDTSDNEEEENDDDNFYGQWHNFRTAFRSLLDVGVRVVNGVPQPRETAKAIEERSKELHQVCITATAKFTNMCEDDDISHDPVNELTHLRKLVQDFERTTDNEKPESILRKTVIDLYRCAIPDLVGLLRYMIRCYKQMDEGKAEARNGPLTIGHLRQVTVLMESILQLTSHAGKYPKPPTNLAIVKPIKERVRPPLRKALSVLSKVVYQHNSAQKAAATRAQWETTEAEQCRHREAEQRRRQEAYKVRRKWAMLHEERIAAEGGLLCLTRAKLQHLLLPVPRYVPSTDGNGQPFLREELLTTRAGPLPEHVDAARALVWTVEQLTALHDGLLQHQGELVFEKIFREHCRRESGVLNRYSVTEIVTVASDLKANLLRMRRLAGVEAEEWLKAIPVWVQPRTQGVENTGQQPEISQEDVVL